MLRPLALCLLTSIATLCAAQQWVELMQDEDVPFDQVKAAYEDWAATHPVERGKGRKVFERWAWFMEPRMHATGLRPDPATYALAWKKVKAMQQASSTKSLANWTPVGPTSWQSTSYNPGNGRVNVVLADPNTPTTIYAGTPAGGLWRSVDDGQSWSPLFTDLPTLGVSGIAIHPVNGTLYVATGDGDGTDSYSMGVIQSSDGGLTWTSTGLDWQTAQVRTTNALRMHPTDPNTLFCASSHGLWKTSDGAITWARVAQGKFRDVEFNAGDPSIVYASTDQLFRSTDGGSTFTTITSGLPSASSTNRMQVAVTPADPNTVYVLAGAQSDGAYLGLYRSIDGGVNFTLGSDSPNLFGYEENGSDNGGQSWYDMALAVGQGDPDVVLVGGINVWRSDDGGATWEIKSHWIHPSQVGYTHADIHDITIQGGIIYVGSDGGLFRSTNGGATWADLSAGLDITQFYRLGGSPDNASLIMAGAQDNGCNLFDGTTWTHVSGADGMECIVTPGQPDVIYAASQNGSINRSDDGGLTFQNISGQVTEDGAWVTPYALDPNDPNVLIAGYQNLWRSPDGGWTWNQLSTLAPSRKVQSLAVAPSNSDVMYFATDLDMYATDDGGLSFYAIGTTLPDLVVTSIIVDPLDEFHLYVSLSGYADGDKVLESLDGGTTWIDRSGNLPNVPVNSLALDPVTEGLYAGTDLGVFYWDAQLSDWQPFSQGLPNCIVTEVEVTPNTGKLRAATFGRGLWETDLFVSTGAPPVADLTISSTSTCAGVPITYSDASLEAAPGWNWSFPGGQPATSTDQRPVVTYATAGTYTATLTVSNSAGSDSHTASVIVTVLPNPVTITVNFDNYPKETSWSITDDLTGQAVANGGPYVGHEVLSTQTISVCLEQGCYTFTIEDSYGDGLCCGSGNGSYTVTNPDLGTIASGGNFSNSASTAFCVSQSVVLPSVARGARPELRPTDVDGVFTLGLEGMAGSLQLSVLDAVGRVVLTGSTTGPVVRHPVDLRAFSSGTYTVMLRSDQGVWTGRVVRP